MLLLGLLFGFLSVSQIEGTLYYIADVYFDEVSDEYFDVAGTQAEPVVGETGPGNTGVAMNLTIIKQIPAEALSHLNLYQKIVEKFDSPTCLTQNAPWCVLWKDPIILKSLGTALGISVDNCPPPIGIYQATFWLPPISDQKIVSQSGDYKVTYSLTLGNKTLLSLVCLVYLV